MKNIIKNKKFIIAIITIILIIILSICIKILNTKASESELSEVKEYVKNHYLNKQTLESLKSGNKDNFEKMSAAIISINRDNGSKLEKISEEDVAKRYKQMYNEEMKITEVAFLLSNGYKYNYDDKSFELFKEANEEITEDDLKLDDQNETDYQKTTRITSCKKIKKDQYEINFEDRMIKPAVEFIDYANNHENSGFDIQKIEEITERDKTEEDEKYLYDLINDDNIEELTTVEESGKIVVNKTKDGYSVEKYEEVTK